MCLHLPPWRQAAATVHKRRTKNPSQRSQVRHERCPFCGCCTLRSASISRNIVVFKRLFIKASSGRKRFNVLGALNAVTHELVTVTNDTYINAQSFCDLLRRISRLDNRVPITLVLDNVRYQKCQLVWELAEALDIELRYILSYSSNLNLIKRL